MKKSIELATWVNNGRYRHDPLQPIVMNVADDICLRRQVDAEVDATTWKAIAMSLTVSLVIVTIALIKAVMQI